MWDYMFFRIYLSLKDSNTYDGVESYIATLANEDDIGWIPKGKTLGINDGAQAEEAAESERRMKNEFNQLTDSLQNSLRQNFDSVAQSQQSDSLEMRDVINALKGDVENLKSKVEELSTSFAK